MKKSITDCKRIFIAGPMRGYEKYNFPKFDRIEKLLNDFGIDCVNPGRISRRFKEKDVNSDVSVYNEMVRLQQEAERTCDSILLLDGWQWSKGVQLEVKTAAELGMQFLLESDIPKEPEQKKISKEKEIELAQEFFRQTWVTIEGYSEDTIYDLIDPECEVEGLCEILNNNTVLEVLKLGFKEKYGVELKVEE